MNVQYLIYESNEYVIEFFPAGDSASYKKKYYSWHSQNDLKITFYVFLLLAFIVHEPDALSCLEILIMLVILHLNQIGILHIALFAEIESILTIEVSALTIITLEF